MSFSEDFAIALDAAGVAVDPASVPEQQVLEQGLQKVREWTGSLEESTRDAVDEFTGDFGQNAALADPEVDIASELSGVLQAFDAAKTDRSISMVLEMCEQVIAQVTG